MMQFTEAQKRVDAIRSATPAQLDILIDTCGLREKIEESRDPAQTVLAGIWLLSRPVPPPANGDEGFRKAGLALETPKPATAPWPHVSCPCGYAWVWSKDTPRCPFCGHKPRKPRKQ